MFTFIPLCVYYFAGVAITLFVQEVKKKLYIQFFFMVSMCVNIKKRKKKNKTKPNLKNPRPRRGIKHISRRVE